MATWIQAVSADRPRVAPGRVVELDEMAAQPPFQSVLPEVVK